MNKLYIVARVYEYSLDKKDTTWYTLFISLDFKTAKNYLDNVDTEEFRQVYLCEVPLNTELDIVSWRQYIVTGRPN